MESIRTALITGASRGIGRACAQALATTGVRVMLAARNRELLEQAAAGVREQGGEAHVIELDMSTGESIKSAITGAAKEFGPIDILINNAAITRDGIAMRMKKQDWDAVIDTNLSGAFLACQAVLPSMMKERWGRIVNISSVVARSGNAGQANYAAAKAGLIGLTKSLAQEMGSRGITVNAVAPGFIATDMTAGLSDELKAKILGNIPLGRFGAVEDVAAAVEFLCGDRASYITGQVIDVNGGMYM
ncbi:MAG: 3-oxoacyl-[acyl-carrier-protein] reductase [Acidobacteriota bacterium]|nr:3-oxoacyl-[acyl-carrier-protein] reductase [Acidobacteriota bacterium]